MPSNYSGLSAQASPPPGFLTRLYYRVKPFIPRNLSWALRRVRLPGILERSKGEWPIDEAAGSAPEGWKGWPEGKRFALVLTHDVESQAGLDNIERVMDLETRYGLRSSFNFIPEGPYETPVELRERLMNQGFEVGVHDLYHDGHLYESREGFSEKAKSINRYLKEWGAVGFRSGFMLRQLDWLHELDIVYDASTFDTDPFEPQPDGSHTIFPFHIQPPEGVKGPGYVELSYTLPQDSTLFILMREQTAAIWKQKLDWVARHGGLALVNIHPDYVDFSGDGAAGSQYPGAILEDFLAYVGGQYEGEFWNPLARDLAVWFRDQSLEKQNSTAGKAGRVTNRPTKP